MIDTDDHGNASSHGPSQGCTFRKCGLDEPETCPFVADGQPPAPQRVDITPPHEHDWRQYWADHNGVAIPEGYWCIKCLARHD